jgi:hypothetical protein
MYMVVNTVFMRAQLRDQYLAYGFNPVDVSNLVCWILVMENAMIEHARRCSRRASLFPAETYITSSAMSVSATHGDKRCHRSSS